MLGEVEAARHLPRDIFGRISRSTPSGVERDDSNRVAVLAGHQIADEGFEIGFADIGFRECRAEVSIIVENSKAPLFVGLKHESGVLEPQSITADGRCGDIGRSLRHWLRHPRKTCSRDFRILSIRTVLPLTLMNYCERY